MLNPDYRDILSGLNAAGADYLLVGAYALAVHGLPRATGDIDILLRPHPANAERVWVALERFGAPLGGLSREDFTRPGMVVQIGTAPRRVDLLTSLDGVGFEEAWAGRVVVEVEGLRIPVLGRAELIRNKKAVARPQDLADVERLEKK
jgi:hypothetical protein